MLKNATAKRFAVMVRDTGMGLGIAAVFAFSGSDFGVEGPNAVPSSTAAAGIGATSAPVATAA